MAFEMSAQAALWFLPFVLPICLWVAWSDMRSMKIPNTAVLSLVAIFLVIGLIALPLPDYGWRFSHLAALLAAGIVANAAGLMGAGDAKFIAAAAPFVALGDAASLALIFAVTLIGAFITHRVAMYTPLQRLAPDWQSWRSGKKFPMGFALGGTLALYLALGVAYGS